MKKIMILTVIGLVALNGVYAQISKGSILLGGDLSVGFGKQENDTISVKQNSFTFRPMLAKAIKENLFVGAYIGYGVSNWSYINNPEAASKSNSYGVGILIRQYKSIVKNFYIFGEANLGYNSTKTEYENKDYPDNYYAQKNNSIGLYITPGVSYAITNKFHIEAGFNNILSLNYSTSKSEYSDPNTPLKVTKGSGLSLNTSLNNANSQLFLGFRILLQKG